MKIVTIMIDAMVNANIKSIRPKTATRLTMSDISKDFCGGLMIAHSRRCGVPLSLPLAVYPERTGQQPMQLGK